MQAEGLRAKGVSDIRSSGSMDWIRGQLTLMPIVRGQRCLTRYVLFVERVTPL